MLEFDAFKPGTTGLRSALDERTIDVFIDDGPHTNEAILATAASILPLMSQDFVYVIEDNAGVAESLRSTFPGLHVESLDRMTVLRPR